MAKFADVQYIATACGIELKDKAVEGIARKTQNEFDPEWVITELALIDKPEGKDIIKIINKAKPLPKAHCGKCKQGFIYSLNRTMLRDMMNHEVTIETPIMLPKSMAYCPNCGLKTGNYQTSINKMNTNEIGWAWVILYEFATYHLQQSTTPHEFNPNELWASIEIYPELNQQQIKIMNSIWEYAQNRVMIHTPDLNPIIQKTIRGIA